VAFLDGKFEIDGKKSFLSGGEVVETLPPYKLLSVFCCEEELKKAFAEKILDTGIKGLDRLNGRQFNNKLDEHCSNINRKCMSGKYEFTPYAEVLQLKGRGKPPRVIGIPTVRDRLVLNQLKIILSHIFPECVPKVRANTLIHKISREIKHIEESGNSSSTKIFGCDIQKFYDEIDRGILLKTLQKRISSPKLLKLIESAICTPTVPRNYRKRDIALYKAPKGIPQGLAISNILAAIYLLEFDAEINQQKIHFYRYVDDILIFGEDSLVDAAKALVETRLSALGLKTHPVGSGKSHLGQLTEEFAYLGYCFHIPLITVRPATQERFLLSIVGKFSDYIHNKKTRLEHLKFLDVAKLKEIFLLELNERITGAICEKRRYGWISYFSEITDLELLKKMDRLIAAFFKRLDDFDNTPPPNLKKITRAYYEMRYSPMDGYIHNYDIFTTTEQKMKFLIERGRLDPSKSSYSEDEIQGIFDAYKARILAELEPDDGTIYW
jgi:retron-type reverse transcriptase